MKHAAMLALCALAACSPSPDRPPPATLAYLPALAGGYFPLASAETGRTYHIYVRLPEGYAQAPDKRYPVVYLLDGDSLFPLLAAGHLFLTYDDAMPEAIIVGIAYGSFDPAVNKRHIDFMVPGGPDEAGAPAFQRFLGRELLPRIEAGYRADPARRILFGQSRGGSFVLWSALAEPDLFWGRIASNPAINPAGAYDGPPAPAKQGDLRLTIVSGTADRPRGRAELAEWRKGWENRSGLPWRFEIIEIPGGTHAASVSQNYRAAMRRFFGLPAGN